VKPEDLFKPEAFPDDLLWIVAEYRLNPRDPVFLLLAWHWHRMKACEDTIRMANAELKAAVDSRLELLGSTAETVAGVSEALAEVQLALEGKPAQLAEEFSSQLKQPMADAVARLKELEGGLSPLVKDLKVVQRRQMLAALVTGVALGVLAAAIILCA
jgi:hypothetical protein